jgi:hypothetical protein
MPIAATREAFRSVSQFAIFSAHWEFSDSPKPSPDNLKQSQENEWHHD